MERNNTNSNEIFEILLRDSLSEKIGHESEELSKSAVEHAFETEFSKAVGRIAKGINSEERKRIAYKVTFRSLTSIACALGIVFCLLLTQPTVYAAVRDVIRDTFSAYDSYTYQGDNDEKVFDNSKQLGYVPSGYVLRFCYYADANVSQTYENLEGKQLYFDYGIANGSNMNIDNESHTLTEFNMEGVTFYFYETQDEYEFNILLWYEDGYKYSIDAQLGLEEIVKIAENIK